MITIDGQDGGGQILRTALSLSMVLGKPFRITNIRGKRSKPGLMRQHLTCVKAAQKMTGATVDGMEISSQELVFSPGGIRAGEYEFAIGSAGSTTLLFQTILPALLSAGETSSVKLIGGTHNPMAPSADFISRSFIPLLRRMGAELEFSCERLGFAPAGGGVISAEVKPVDYLDGLDLSVRSKLVTKRAEIVSANLRPSIVDDELKQLEKMEGWDTWDFNHRTVTDVDGQGNVLALELGYKDYCVHMTSHGKFGKPASRVVRDAIKMINTFQNSAAVIDSRLADQMLLPMALAGGGRLKINAMTNHIETNIRTIEAFIEGRFLVEPVNPGEIFISRD